VDRYTTLLRATSSTERQCATIDNKGGGEGVRKKFVLGGKGTRGVDTQIYIVYIEGDVVDTEGSPHPPILDYCNSSSQTCATMIYCNRLVIGDLDP
jgi:hypothetical protein